ncbi:MAG: hypothetical protein WCJ30_01625, partial [Deltaproteobacteria bacterium]
MAGLLRRPTFVLVALASFGLLGCPPPVENPDTTGTDASDIARDNGPGPDAADVIHADAPPADVTATGCATAMIGACNLVTNAGCAAGQMCVFSDNGDGGTTGACAPTGTGGTGAPCTSADSCLQGLACLGTPGLCTKLCCAMGDNDPCRTGPGGQRGATCSIPLSGLPLFACLATTNCDWFAQDCPSGGNCRPVDTAGTTTCEAAGTGVDGTACSGAGAVACARGFACISLSSP